LVFPTYKRLGDKSGKREKCILKDAVPKGKRRAAVVITFSKRNETSTRSAKADLNQREKGLRREIRINNSAWKIRSSGMSDAAEMDYT